MARSLPDVRDGLKPVHRRILHAMHELRLDPGSGYKKCARVVGDVIGKFHPHGELAVYEALVRLAQDFAQRYPLVDGQGNFGNIDGDNAAAMRYTESRLSAGRAGDARRASTRTRSISARPMTARTASRSCLPGRFPNLLANGAAGIAVGMATSIPPHNAGELCGALLHLIDNPHCATAELVRMSPAPIFRPAACWSSRRRAFAEAYATGRGSFRLRARWRKEPLVARPLPDRRHRDPVSGAEKPADREDRGAARREEAAAARRYPRRIGRATSASSSNRKTATSMPTC